MEHPAIERIVRTGYPQKHVDELPVCEQCNDEIIETLVYDGITFCSPACLGKYLLGNGDAKWSA